MTIQLSETGLTQIKEAIKDLRFRKAFKRLQKDEKLRLRSRKNLLIFSLIYGSAITYLLTQIL